MVSRRELSHRCDVLSDTVAGLALEVSRLRKDMERLQEQVEAARKTDGMEDPSRDELLNRKFQAGLDEILSYTGRPVKEDQHGEVR